MTGCPRKFSNTSLLDEEIYEELGSVDDVMLIPLGLEQRIVYSQMVEED